MTIVDVGWGWDGEGKGRTNDAFQASSNMNAAPNVPVMKLAASNPALFFGTPLGSRPIINPAPRIVGMIHISMTDDRSRHLSERYPTRRTHIAPIAPLGALRRSAWREEKPKVVSRILEKFESPPLGMELRRVQRQTSQTRRSLNVSKTFHKLSARKSHQSWDENLPVLS